MFEGFEDTRIDVGELRLRVRYAGTGPPVLLIHGHPRTGATWHRVAPRLVAEGLTVICPDMRGYGQSDKPTVRPDHSQQSKRTVANELVQLMDVLGHDTFTVAGHDRGCYVALRMALDHPDRIDRLIAMDGVPISEALRRCDAAFARDWYHWFFFAQPEKPERAIMADPEAWYGGDPEAMGAGNFDEYRRAINDPATVTAMLEDYRAGLGIDREHEEADYEARRTVTCPVLLLWSTNDSLPELYGDPTTVWRPWARELTSAAITSGHHMAEDNPDALSKVIIDFLHRPGHGCKSQQAERLC